MTKQEIMDFLRTNSVSFLATVENGEPRVRGMAHYITTDNRVVYHTGKLKSLGRQVQGGSPLELCAFDPASGVQVRVRGKAQIVDDPALIEQIFDARPYLKQMAEVIGMDAFLLFSVAEPKATTWTMATNMAPVEWTDL